MSNQKIRNDLKEILNISKPKIICKMNNSCREEACQCLNLARQILMTECEKKKPSLWSILQRKNWKLSCDSITELKGALSEIFETCEVRLSEFPEPQIDAEEFVDHLCAHIEQALECKYNETEDIPTFAGDDSELNLQENIQEISVMENQRKESSRIANEDSACEMLLDESTLKHKENSKYDILDGLSLQRIGTLEHEMSQDRSTLDEEDENNDEFVQEMSCESDTGHNLKPRADDEHIIENHTSVITEEVRQEEITGSRDEHSSLMKSNEKDKKASRVMQLGRQTYAQREANKLENLRIKKARAEATKQNLDAKIRNRCIQNASERERRQKQAAQRRQQAEEERIRRIIMRSKINHYQTDK